MTGERSFAGIRRARGISLERAAIHSGYSESHLRAVEAGRAPLTPPLAAALARIYGVGVGEIVRPPSRGEA